MTSPSVRKSRAKGSTDAGSVKSLLPHTEVRLAVLGCDTHDPQPRSAQHRARQEKNFSWHPIGLRFVKQTELFLNSLAVSADDLEIVEKHAIDLPSFRAKGTWHLLFDGSGMCFTECCDVFCKTIRRATHFLHDYCGLCTLQEDPLHRPTDSTSVF